MLSYTGTKNKYNHTINIPQDAVDNVDAITVDPAFQNLADGLHYTVASLGYRPHVCLEWASGSSVLVSAFGGLSVDGSGIPLLAWLTDSYSGAVTLTSADLEGGGSFAVDTCYFVYAVVNITANVPSTNIIISTDAPDFALLYKSMDRRYRYLGHFLTDGAAAIIPFQMIDFRYLFLEEAFSPQLLVDNMTATDTQTFALPTPYPKQQIKSLLLKMDVVSAETNTSFLSMKPSSWPGTGYIFDFAAKGAGASYWNYSLEIPTLIAPAKSIDATLQNGGTGTITARINYLGYTE